jgi:hypothetical protein
MNFKDGDIIAVMYDSLMSRAKRGIVLSRGPGDPPEYYVVRFTTWGTEEQVEITFELADHYYEGLVQGEAENGILRSLGCEGDCYILGNIDELESQGYVVK